MNALRATDWKLLGKRLVATLLLWIPFSLLAVVAIFVSLWAIWARGEEGYAKDVLRAMDKLGAAVFRWGGFYTVSAECGSRHEHIAGCRFACKILGWFDPGHCRGAAVKEGLLNNSEVAAPE